MSYLTSIAILECDKTKDKIPYILLPAFSGMGWIMNKNNKKCISHMNKQVINYIKKEPNGFTNLSKLITAPVDEVIIIGNKEKYSFLKTSPIPNISQKDTFLNNHLNL